MIEFRCENCNKRLFDFKKLRGNIEIKCPRCGEMNYVTSGGSFEKEFVVNPS
ncbi:MAG: Com family DNA-binding transcriptional regulator [Bacillota bacterium]